MRIKGFVLSSLNAHLVRLNNFKKKVIYGGITSFNPHQFNNHHE
jgi:hypothetical protein